MWILLIVVITVLFTIVYSKIENYKRSHYIPREELYQRWVNPNSESWSPEKRMHYYDKMRRKNRISLPKTRNMYHNTIETGYVRSNHRDVY